MVLLTALPVWALAPAEGTLEEARSLFAQGQFDEAEQLLEQALLRKPSEADLHMELGRLRLHRNDLVGAAASLERARDLAADPSVLLPMLGQIYLLQERNDEARSALENALRHAPDDIGSLYNLGRLLRLQGEREEAKLLLERALELDPEGRMRRRVQLNLGTLYLETRRFTPALHIYEQFAQAEPRQAQWRLHLALAHEGLGAPRAALEQARESARLEPELAQAHRLIGVQLRTLGDLNAALVACEKALALLPDDIAAMALSASLHLDLGRFEQARQLATRLIEKDPRHSRAHYLLGQALLARGDAEAAEAAFETHRRLASERRAFHHTAASLGDD
ncbi:MAG: tetratricopeptide repeat protein [Acidobacteriota bacterium]